MNVTQNYRSSYYIFLGLLGIVGFLNACTSSQLEPDAKALGYDFFPISVGHFMEYQVNETSYSSQNINAPIDTAYQIREEQTQLFNDIQNETEVKIYRFGRTDASKPWSLLAVWASKRTPSQALRIEDNQTYWNLIFPLKNGATWNGNAYNNFGKKLYEIADFNKPYSINEFNFDRTLKVIQSNDSSLVSQDRRIEVYAEGVGLVSREVKQVKFCYETNCRGKEVIIEGIISKQKIINYGDE